MFIEDHNGSLLLVRYRNSRQILCLFDIKDPHPNPCLDSQRHLNLVPEGTQELRERTIYKD